MPFKYSLIIFFVFQFGPYFRLNQNIIILRKKTQFTQKNISPLMPSNVKFRQIPNCFLSRHLFIVSDGFFLRIIVMSSQLFRFNLQKLLVKYCIFNNANLTIIFWFGNEEKQSYLLNLLLLSQCFLTYSSRLNPLCGSRDIQ